MDFLLSFLPNITTPLHAFWFVFIRGGWVAIAVGIIYVLFLAYQNEIITQFVSDQRWKYLLIKVPRENLTSLLATEQIFSQLHSLHTSLSWSEINLEGKRQLWYSFEIISMGGKISLIVRVPEKMKDNLEAAWYAQYPQAEITEINDYLENVNYHPDESDFDIFGFEMKILQDQVIPTKTYREFEHPSAEVKIVDPLAPVFESLAKLEPWEFYGIQIIAEPLADPEWKAASEKVVKEFLGEEPASEKLGIIGMVKQGLHLYNPARLFEEKKEEEKVSSQKNFLLSLTEVEKERINNIQRKASKPGYKCKIRFLYMAPKDKMDGAKKTVLIGAYRVFGDTNTNGFKPDVQETWTDVKYRLSPNLEAPYIEWEIERRKRHFWKGYKNRSYWIGRQPFILNIEELATIFHLPLSGTPGAAPVERVDSKKSQAPVNLPVA